MIEVDIIFVKPLTDSKSLVCWQILNVSIIIFCSFFFVDQIKLRLAII